jgi:putative ABC transport system substrate-binding protein
LTSLAGAVAGPLVAAAQQADKLVRIGYLSPMSTSQGSRSLESLRRGVAEFGYVERCNVVIEARFAEGHFDRLADLALDLVHLKVDVIVTMVTAASLAAKAAAGKTPIVMVGVQIQ